jgi:8-oxo-dGTP diphosphatase
MRALVETLMGIWPVNRVITFVWRRFPFPKGARSRIMRTANDSYLVGVMVIIQDDAGRYLLVRNTYDPRFPWGLPGGWMGGAEQPEDCAVREVLEETGFQIVVDDLLSAHTRKRLPSVDLVFRASIAGGAFRPSAEIVEAAYFGIDSLPDGLSPTHQRMLLGLAAAAPVERRVS